MNMNIISKLIIFWIIAVISTPSSAQSNDMIVKRARSQECHSASIVNDGKVTTLPSSQYVKLRFSGSTLYYSCNKKVPWKAQLLRQPYSTKNNYKYICPAGTIEIIVTQGARSRGFFNIECYRIPKHNNESLGDTIYSSRVCNQPLIDKFWRDFDFDRKDWDDGLGYYHPCDIDRPLNRTFSALWALLYSSPYWTTSLHEFGGDILRWGYNYAAREIDEIDGSLADDGNLATSSPACFLFCNKKVVLKPAFFYSEYASVPERASTIIHEARHQDGKPHDGCSCPDGGTSCDKDWPANHVDWQRYGANVYQVMYLWHFADSAVSTTPPIKQRALQRSNLILNGRFCSRPNFNIITLPQYRIRLRSINGQYLLTEGGGGGAVLANGYSNRDPVLDAWETFTIFDATGGELESGDYIYIRAYDGHYIAAAGGGGGTLQVDRNTPNSWETFRIRKVHGAGKIDHQDTITLQSSKGWFVVAEQGGGGLVNVNRSQPGPWEQFTLLFQ